jgi:hypothetical protein
LRRRLFPLDRHATSEWTHDQLSHCPLHALPARQGCRVPAIIDTLDAAEQVLGRSLTEFAA